MIKDLISDTAMSAITMEKGSAPIIITERNASIPPAVNNTPISMVNNKPQIIICFACFWF